MKAEKVEATDGSGNYAIIIADDDGTVVEIQEYDKTGQLIQRVYGDTVVLGG